MAIVSMKRLLKHARENHYLIGYFEAFNMDALLGVLDAAEDLDSPVIIGFGGQFIGSPKRGGRENIYNYGALAREAAKRSRVPAAVLLNEADSEDMIYNGIYAGFNAVMYQKKGEDYERTKNITREICKIAHMLNIDVEGEVGELASADISTGTLSPGTKTDLVKAARFVEETGVDALAVAVGNIHLLEDGKSSIDYELLGLLSRKIQVPLVLHGGTGISKEGLKRAADLGVSKINVGTALKRAYIEAVSKYYRENDVAKIDPHVTIGWGGADDMITRGRAAIADKTSEFISIFGSAGKAPALTRICHE